MTLGDTRRHTGAERNCARCCCAEPWDDNMTITDINNNIINDALLWAVWWLVLQLWFSSVTARPKHLLLKAKILNTGKSCWLRDNKTDFNLIASPSEAVQSFRVSVQNPPEMCFKLSTWDWKKNGARQDYYIFFPSVFLWTKSRRRCESKLKKES